MTQKRAFILTFAVSILQLDQKEAAKERLAKHRSKTFGRYRSSWFFIQHQFGVKARVKTPRA